MAKLRSVHGGDNSPPTHETENLSYLAELDLPADEMPVYCSGCAWPGTFADVMPIEACRLTPGDASPAGRCPCCGGLVYPGEFPEGGIFDVRAGLAGDLEGRLLEWRCGEYDSAERIAEFHRNPGQWARVEESGAFTSGPNVLWLPALLADAIGGQQIQQMANRFAKPILTKPGGKCSHAQRVYWPES